MLGLIGALNPKRFPIFLCVYVIAIVAVRIGLPERSPYEALSMPFVLGMTAYRYREAVPTSWLAVLTVAVIWAAALISGVLREDISTIALGYFALRIGLVNTPLLLKYNRVGDYSYGTYIYAWPIQQVLVATAVVATPLALFFWSAAGVIIMGALSWHFVEHPALKVRHQITGLVANLFMMLRRGYSREGKIASDAA